MSINKLCVNRLVALFSKYKDTLTADEISAIFEGIKALEYTDLEHYGILLKKEADGNIRPIKNTKVKNCYKLLYDIQEYFRTNQF